MFLRNESGQSLFIQKTDGTVVHVFPKRAVALTEEELNSSQVRSLIARGLARTQKIDPATRKTRTAKAKPAGQKPEKHEAQGSKPGKKKDES